MSDDIVKCPICGRENTSDRLDCPYCRTVINHSQAIDDILMFKNIEGKIKKLATAATLIGIIISIVIGIAIILRGVEMNGKSMRGNPGDYMVWSGIGIMIAGSLLSWASSLVLYGFGKLIEYAKIIAENTKPLNKFNKLFEYAKIVTENTKPLSGFGKLIEYAKTTAESTKHK